MNTPATQLLPVRSLSALQTSRDGGTSAGDSAVTVRLSPGRRPTAPAPPAGTGPAAAPSRRFHTFRLAPLFFFVGGVNYMKRATKPDEPRFPRFVFVWRQRRGRSNTAGQERSVCHIPAQSDASASSITGISHRSCPREYGPGAAGEDSSRNPSRNPKPATRQGRPAEPVRGAATSARHTPSAGCAG